MTGSGNQQTIDTYTEDSMRWIRNAMRKAAYHARKEGARDLTRLLSGRHHVCRAMYNPDGERHVDGIVSSNLERAREARDRYRDILPLGKHLDALVRAYEHWQAGNVEKPVIKRIYGDWRDHTYG